jgi:UDP-glucoronosyl and UDP-glucosyl transferase
VVHLRGPSASPGPPPSISRWGRSSTSSRGTWFTRVLAGLAQLPVNVLVTVGREIDPAELGPQPENVHVERYLPQTVILPRCEVVVFHGGSGTLTGALAHGLPMVILAMGADQPANAMRCQDLGLGISRPRLHNSPLAWSNATLSGVAPGGSSAQHSQRRERQSYEQGQFPDLFMLTRRT